MQNPLFFSFPGLSPREESEFLIDGYRLPLFSPTDIYFRKKADDAKKKRRTYNIRRGQNSTLFSRHSRKTYLTEGGGGGGGGMGE